MRDDFIHGGALDRVQAAFPSAPTPWTDLSTGINPWPYRVPQALLAQSHMERLPTQQAFHACRNAMANAFGCKAENVLPVPGTEMVIRLLPTFYKRSQVTILDPSYADHRNAWRGQGHDVTLAADPLANASQIHILCNPNNPDGRRFAPEAILHACKTAELVLVDEAYTDLNPRDSAAPYAGQPSLLVLRSFGKFFGLAGLRLGALLGPEDVLDRVSSRLGHWSVSAHALAIGAQAYADILWQENMRAKLSKERTQLDKLLQEAGHAQIRGTDLFRFIEVGDAHALWHQLATQGIYVRRFEWSRTHLRIGLPPDSAALGRLSHALSL